MNNSAKNSVYKNYYWIKLKKDFFQEPAMKIIRDKIGYDGIVVYQKMLLFTSDKKGVIRIPDLYDGDIISYIALLIDENPEMVEQTINLMSALEMIIEEDDTVILPMLEDMVGDETYSAAYMRAKRKKNSDVTQEINNVNRDRDKETDTVKEDTDTDDNKTCDIIVSYFNETCICLPTVSKMTDKRKSLILNRVRETSLDKVKTAIKKVQESDFLNGKNENGWKASFDWIMKASNFQKILEGNYANRTGTHNRHEVFKRHTQAEYLNDNRFEDFRELMDETDRT